MLQAERRREEERAAAERARREEEMERQREEARLREEHAIESQIASIEAGAPAPGAALIVRKRGESKAARTLPAAPAAASLDLGARGAAAAPVAQSEGFAASEAEEDEANANWVPPTNQTGDGRTHLNAKLGY
jgi:hypothetical protein